jgi:hypothetical protein
MTCESDPSSSWMRLVFSTSTCKDAVLRPLRVEEVMAIDVGVGLQLAVDAAVALLHPAGVPGNVEMEKVPAMRLQVEALARCIRGDQNPHRMLLGIGIEGFLDAVALRGCGVGP